MWFGKTTLAFTSTVLITIVRLRQPSHGDERGGYAVLLMSGIAIGLHHNVADPGEKYHESRTGLGPIALVVATRPDLDRWAAWLDELGVAHSGVIDTDNPMPYSVVVFRDPDNIQLELFHMDG